MPGSSQQTAQPLALALDIGTSSVRGALYDERGDEIENTQAQIKRSLCTTDDGGAEINAEEAIEQVASTIDEVLARSRHLAANIETIAVSCFWHSLVGTSREGQALTPVFGWADTRAARFAEELKSRLDERATHTRTGCRFHPSYWPAKLLWLRQEYPEVYGSVWRWMSFGELIASAFFDETRMSVSLASGTGLMDLRSLEWDAELLESLDIGAERLPAIADEHKPFIKLRDRYARRWPQINGARWFPAVADGAANNIGAGCTSRERVALMIGTSGAMRVLWEGEPPRDLPPALWCYRADRRRVVVGGALSDGGGLYKWMNDALALADDLKRTEEALAGMEMDAHGLTILPFWAGERSTGWNTSARGAILGLTMHTRPLDILRASMEAISYRFALIARVLDAFAAPGAKIIASGGALAASHVWSQMLADVLGRPVHLSALAEASSRGALVLALEAQGKLKSIENAPLPFVETFVPEMARHKRYLAGLERQQRLYARLVGDQEISGAISEASSLRAENESEPRCQPSIQQSEETS